MLSRDGGIARDMGRVLIALTLGYLITVHTVPGWLATSAPDTALRFNAGEPTALSLLAERSVASIIREKAASQPASDEQSARLEGFARLPKLDLREGTESETQSGAPDAPAASGRTIEETDNLLKRSIIASPLNAQAMGLIGMLGIGSNDDAKAERFMRAASAISHRTPAGNYWLMRSSFEAGDNAAALEYADLMLRQSLQNITVTAPIIGRIAEASPALILPVLAKGPRWRMAFFLNLSGNIKDARAPLNLLLQLKESPYPPLPPELGAYIKLLIDNHLWELAYNAWLQFLPPEKLANAGFINNGGFDFPPEDYVYPFDWIIKSGAGVIADVVPVEGTGNNALLLKFGPGRVDYKPVSQTILLSPGSYILKSRYRSDIKSRRGFKWQVECLGKENKVVAATESINGKAAEWTELSLKVLVPTDDCRAQLVSLILDARSSSETLVSGTLVADDMAIVRDQVDQGEKTENP